MTLRTYNLAPELIERLRDVPGCTALGNGQIRVSESAVQLVDIPMIAKLAPAWSHVIKQTLTVHDAAGGERELYAHQKTAIRALRATDRLLLCDEMGAGKTASAWWGVQLALSAAATTKARILIVAPKVLETTWRREVGAEFFSCTGVDIRKSKVLDEPKGKAAPGVYFIHYDILHDWASRIARHDWDFIIFDEIHTCSSPKSKRSRAALAIRNSARGVVCLTGTPLVNRPADLWVPLTLTCGGGEWGTFFQFRQRYCLPPTAPVLLADFTEKPIKDIRAGDRIVGWSKTSRGNRSLVEAEVVAHLTRKSKLQRVHLSDGTSIVCTPDHQWLNGYAHTNVDQQYSVARTNHGRSRVVRIANGGVKYAFIDSDDYKRGYLTGMMRGDGTVSRVFQSIEHPYEPRKDRGVSIKSHKISLRVNDVEIVDRVAAYLKHFNMPFSRPASTYIEASNTTCFDFMARCDAKRKSRAWYAGFLGGIYDAEGCGRTISQYKKINPRTYWLIQKSLKVFDFKFRSRPKDIHIRADKKEFFRFWSIAAPALKRKLMSTIYKKGAKFMSDRLKVVKIEPISGMHVVHTLTTTTGNYVAYGLGSRNCGAVQMTERSGTYWVDTGPTNTEELQARMAPYYLRREKKEIAELSHLPAFRRQRVDIDMDDLELRDHQEELRRHMDDVMHALNGGRGEIGLVTRLRQHTSRAKLPTTFDRIDALLAAGKHVVVFVAERKTAEKIADIDVGIPRWVATGDATADERAKMVDEFQAHAGAALIVATYQALGQGVTLTAAEDVILHDLPWTFKDALQAEARVHRIGQTRPTMSHWMVVEGSIDDFVARVLLDKARACESIGIDDAQAAAEELDLASLTPQIVIKHFDDALSRHFGGR